jgi:hypothetical protein
VRSYPEKALHKKGLMEWLRVKALSSSPSTTKQKTKNKKTKEEEEEKERKLLVI